MDDLENTGEENANAAGSPGESDQTGVQSDSTPAAGENQEVEGLKAAAIAEREKRQAAEFEAQTLKDQMAVMNANPPPKAQQQTLYKGVAQRLGIDPEYATPEEQGQILEGMMQVQMAQQANQSFILSKPDFGKVVGVALPNGQFTMAAPLSRILSKNPALAQALGANPDPRIAYQLASQDPVYLQEVADAAKTPEQKAAEQAAATIKAANQQRSISEAPGGGQTDASRAVSGVDLTDEEFEARNQALMEKAT